MLGIPARLRNSVSSPPLLPSLFPSFAPVYSVNANLFQVLNFILHIVEPDRGMFLSKFFFIHKLPRW